MGSEPREGDVRQSDLVAELNLNPCAMKAIRAEHLATRDWYKVGRTIWLTPEGATKLRIWSEVKGDSAHIAHQFIEGYVIGPHPHPEWLAIRILNGNGEWLKVPCRVPRKLKKRYTAGKKIRVEVVQSNSETGYRHESFANYPSIR